MALLRASASQLLCHDVIYFMLLFRSLLRCCRQPVRSDSLLRCRSAVGDCSEIFGDATFVVVGNSFTQYRAFPPRRHMDSPPPKRSRLASPAPLSPEEWIPVIAATNAVLLQQPLEVWMAEFRVLAKCTFREPLGLDDVANRAAPRIL